LLPTRALLSKSNDELSTENCDTINNDLLCAKHMSNSVDSLKNESLINRKIKRKLCIQSKKDKFDKQDLQCNAKQSLGSMEFSSDTSLREINAMTTHNKNDSGKLMRQFSEPLDMYSTHNTIDSDDSSMKDSELVRQNSEPVLALAAMPNVQTSSLKACTSNIKPSKTSNIEPHGEGAYAHNLHSPIVKNRFRNVYAVHTSTPSGLLRRSLATNDYILTPITNNDRSMSPITQSATKMTKAMQVYIKRYDNTNDKFSFDKIIVNIPICNRKR